MKLTEFINQLEAISELAKDEYDMSDPHIVIRDNFGNIVPIGNLSLDISFGIVISTKF